jgi:peptidoglycan/xylan/chitin deacetylase (PgdA/CDA1 family)
VTRLTPRERISCIIRTTIAHALYYAGVLQLILSLRLRRKAIVLAYHRVLTPEQRTRTGSHDGMVVEDRTFARHVALLARRFKVLTLDEFSNHLASRRPFRGPSCLVTFDDGWIDNLENALPVLRAHQLSAVMFLPVNFIGRRRLFTREALTHLLVRAIDVGRREPARRDALRAHLSPLGLDSIFDDENRDPLPAVLKVVGSHRCASGPTFEAIVSTLATELGVDAVELSQLDTFIDWDQVAQLGRSGFAFGGHGAEHCVLTRVAPAVAKGEVELSKRELDRRLEGGVKAFAYPNGAWNRDIAQTVRAGGYSLAFTVDPGPVSCDDDPFTLRRINIHDDVTRSTPMFMARLAGIF